MDGNAYSRILQTVRGETKRPAATQEDLQSGLGAADMKVRLGIVTQRAPLKISVAGIEQPTEVLRINERLTEGAKRKVKITSHKSDYKSLSGTLSGPITCPGGHGAPQLGTVDGGELSSKDTTIDEATEEQLEIDLEVGDQVLVLTEDDQVFYIMCKVVKAV